MPVGEGKHLGFIHRARDADDGALVRIQTGVIGAKRLGCRRADAVHRAQDVATHGGLAAERLRLGQVEHPVVGGVGSLGDLLADDALLAFQIVGVQPRPAHKIAQHRHRQRQAAPQAANLEAGALITGSRVD